MSITAGLEKSLDVLASHHVLKLTWIYDLPFGKGRRLAVITVRSIFCWEVGRSPEIHNYTARGVRSLCQRCRLYHRLGSSTALCRTGRRGRRASNPERQRAGRCRFGGRAIPT